MNFERNRLSPIQIGFTSTNIRKVSFKSALIGIHPDTTHRADSLTAELGKNPGSALQEKLLFFLKMKLHPLLYDADINTPYRCVLGSCLLAGDCTYTVHAVVWFHAHTAPWVVVEVCDTHFVACTKSSTLGWL